MAVTVLIVDDDARFRDLARRLLSGWGYQPESEARTVTEAVERVEAAAPDLALVDIGLPDGNGVDLSKRLTGAPWHVRVVLVSSDGDAISTREALAAGAHGFIPKAELSRELLHDMLDQRDAR